MDHAHDLTLFVAAGTIAAAPRLAWVMERQRGWIFLGRDPLVAAGIAIRWSLAVLSMGAAAIHFAVIADHYAEGVLAGLLMSAVAWFQLLWPLTLTLPGAPRRLLDLGALAVNGGAILAWAASRTVGLPAPVGDGRVEPIGTLDILAMSFELGIVLGVAALLLRADRLAMWAVSTRSGSLAVIVLGVMVIVLTTAAIASGAPHIH